MNLQHDRIRALCNTLKLDKVAADWPALAKISRWTAMVWRAASGEVRSRVEITWSAPPGAGTSVPMM